MRPGVPRHVGAVSRENLVGDRRGGYGLGAGSIGSGATRLRREDDLSSEPVARARARQLGKHWQADGQPENGDGRKRHHRRQEPSA